MNQRRRNCSSDLAEADGRRRRFRRPRGPPPPDFGPPLFPLHMRTSLTRFPRQSAAGRAYHLVTEAHRRPAHHQSPLLRAAGRDRRRGSNDRARPVLLHLVVALPLSRTHRSIAGVIYLAALAGVLTGKPNPR
jgi:hypothetical protein